MGCGCRESGSAWEWQEGTAQTRRARPTRPTRLAGEPLRRGCDGPSEFGDALLAHPCDRAGDRQRADRLALVTADGGAAADHARRTLLVVHRVAALADQPQFPPDRIHIDQ